MLIRHKLFLNIGIFILSLILIFIAFNMFQSNSHQLNDAKALAYTQNVNMLSLRRHEKDFLARRDLSYQEKYEKTFGALQSVQSQLENVMMEQGISTNILNELDGLFLSYQDRFNDVVAANVDLGLTPKTGLTGKLRNAVHQIEEKLNSQNKDALLVIMLQLRRAEKDFMLRKDVKYTSKFDTLIDQLKTSIAKEITNTGDKTSLLTLTEKYHTEFNNYVTGVKHIGLTSKDGLLLNMRNDIQKTEDVLSNLITTLDTELENRFDRSIYLITAIMLIIGAFSVVFTLLMNRSIVSPLNNVRQTMNQIHTTHDLNTRLTIHNNDEIGQMSDSINIMLADFQTALRVVLDASDTVSQTSKELLDASSNSTKSVQQQREETNMVASSMTQMVGTVKEISTNMDTVAEQTAKTQKDASQGKLKVDSAINGIVRLSDRLEEAVDTVSKLEKESESIGSVLGVIQGIAEQTNLLALNAAIEAARAGEQGRGFAVVADEVRALASRTHDATVEISEIINSLQERTKSIVLFVGECREDGASSRSDSELIKDVLDTIIQAVGDIAEMSTHVSQSLDEQMLATNEVSKSLENIRTTTEIATDAIAVSVQASDDISTQSASLQKSITTFKIT